MEAIGAAAALADRLDRLPSHQLGQITPGAGSSGSRPEPCQRNCGQSGCCQTQDEATTAAQALHLMKRLVGRDRFIAVGLPGQISPD
jgi:hypothetical protein